jgi:hypothetical protein
MSLFFLYQKNSFCSLNVNKHSAVLKKITVKMKEKSAKWATGAIPISEILMLMQKEVELE